MDKTQVDLSSIITGLTATVSYDDGWIRLRLGERLDRETFDALAEATGLHWKRAEACLAGPWSPQAEDALADLDVPLDEENVDTRAVAEQRAAHYAGWAEDAAEAAEAAAAARNDFLDAIPLGQPILVGHHSEAYHRRQLAKADRNVRRYLDETARAEHWEERAASTVRQAERRYTAEQLAARIGMLETALRRYGRQVEEYKRQEQTADDPERAAAAMRGATWNRRMIAFTERRITYTRHLLVLAENEAGDDVAGSVAARLALAIEVGGGVTTDGPDRAIPIWYEVVRVNTKTVTVNPGGLKVSKTKIKQTMSAAAWAAARKSYYGPGVRILPARSADGAGSDGGRR